MNSFKSVLELSRRQLVTNLIQELPVESMTHQQLMDEVRRWRIISRKMVGQVSKLKAFQEIAETPKAMQAKINEARGELVLKDRQIFEMNQLIHNLREDPLGIEKRFQKPIKIKVH